MTTAEFLIGSDLGDALRECICIMDVAANICHSRHNLQSITYHYCFSELCQAMHNNIIRLRAAARKAGLEL